MEIFNTICIGHKNDIPVTLLVSIEEVYYLYFGKHLIVATLYKEDAEYLFELTIKGYNNDFNTLG